MERIKESPAANTYRTDTKHIPNGYQTHTEQMLVVENQCGKNHLHLKGLGAFSDQEGSPNL